MESSFRLIACPTILHERRTDRYFEPGKSIGECLQEIGWTTDNLSARVFIDGRLVPDAEWLDAKPTAGQAVVVRTVLRGGGGNTGKQVGTIVAMLALVVASFYAPQALAGLASLLGASAGVWGGVLGASTAIQATGLVAGALAINARVPRPLPRRLEAV